MYSEVFRRSFSICFALIFSIGSAHATSILMDDQYIYSHYAYTGAGGTGWTNFSNTLDAASGNNVSVGNFNDLSYMMGFDSIFVNVRCNSCTLSAQEYSNISSYIASGRRAIIIGENTGWADWNQQVVGMLGGTVASSYYNGITNSVSTNELVDGVNQVYLPTGGLVASGGEALFDYNFATLWGDNVVTILDVNVFSDNYWSALDNAAFATNIANWLAAEPATVPETGTLLLMVAGLLLLAGARKEKATGALAL